MSTAIHTASAGGGSGLLDITRWWWPPLRRREFWVVQVLVFTIAGGHALIEMADLMDLHGATFIPVSLYLLPVVYAALAFGLRGATPTAVWSFVLTIPNVLVLHHGIPALGDLWQATLVLFVGLFIGHRVDRERSARRQVEARELERRVSEERYRGLFEMAADPILLLGSDERIVDANAAAALLLRRSRQGLVGLRIGSISQSLAQILPDDGFETDPREIDGPSGPVWVQPIVVPFNDEAGEAHLLVQLHDVTLVRERQHLVESFARDTVVAREEERRRVARDLHDGPLQSLILLWRNLDGIREPSDAASAAALAHARTRAETTADELRQFSRDLRPSVLDDLGLAPALKAEAQRLRERADLDVTVELSDGASGRLPAEVELTLLRIAQEALRNIERHSAAHRVWVQLEMKPSAYRMSIEDDGVGMTAVPSPAALVASGQLGIVGMLERARLVGATCIVRGTDDGTRVAVTGTRESLNEGDH